MKKIISQFTKMDVISYVLLILAGIIGPNMINYMRINHEYNGMLTVLMFIWGINLIVCILKIRERIILALFYLAIFLFLISRIFIPSIQGKQWWLNYSVEANCFAVYAIAVSIVALGAGMAGVEIINKINNALKREKIKVKKQWLDKKLLVTVVRWVLIICMICFYIREIDKVLFMRGKVYEDFFTLYHSRMPFFITFPAGCMQFFLCMFLALKPSKKESFIWLFIYVASALPMLKIGVRNAFILNCIFAFVYYFIRDNQREKNEKKWIGKKEKLLIICIIPAMILFMGAYNYIRAGKGVGLSAGNLVVDFAYKQGTTYDTVLQGYTYKNNLPMSNGKNYTMGALEDSFFYNSFGKRIFKLDDIGDGNCLRQVYNGHTFSHTISYAVLGKDYIAGYGRGSSYIIENYIDWNYTGIVGFSIIVGCICALIPKIFGNNWLISVLCLNIVTSLFFIPRAESTSFITFLVSYKFWICIIGSIIMTKIWMEIEKKKGK